MEALERRAILMLAKNAAEASARVREKD